MATLPPPAGGADPAAGPDLSKLTDDVAKGLGLLYKECSEYDTDGQICGAIGSMIQALGGIEKQIEALAMGAQPGPPAPPDQGPPSDYPVPPGQQGPMDQAGAAMAAMMGGGGGSMPPTQ